MDFDAEQKANQIDQMAMKRLSSGDKDPALAKGLVDEWLLLTKEQRGAVVDLMARKDHYSKDCEAIRTDGDVSGFRCTDRKFIWDKGPSQIVVQDIGGIVSEAQATQHNKFSFGIEYSAAKKAEK